MRPDIDRQQVGKVAAGVGLLVGIVSVLFGGLLQLLLESTISVDAVDILRSGLPIGGLVVIVAVLWEMRKMGTTSRISDPLVGTERAAPFYKSDKVGAEVEQTLDNAAVGWYRCEETYSSSTIQDELERNLVRIIKFRHGLDETAAVEAVESGAWTDDRVAVAFLSPQYSQPVTERLRGALDPGTAFTRRLERTLSAIETLEGHRATGSVGTSDSQTTIYEHSQTTSERDNDDQSPTETNPTTHTEVTDA